MICTECGREINVNQKFCKYCGAPVTQAVVSATNTDQTLKCKGCGAAVKCGNAFCTQCGSPVLPTDVKRLDIKRQDKAKGGKIGKAIIAVITTIVILLLAFIIWYFGDQYGLFNWDMEEQEPLEISEILVDTVDTEDNEPDYEEEELTEDTVTELDGASVVANTDVSNVIDVEDSVLRIRDEYDRIVNGMSSDLYEIIAIDEGVTAYSEQSQIKAIVVKKDYGGYDYARNFYYDGDKLFFAYYEGTDSHRLYFSEDKLIRWRYCPDAKDSSKATNYEFENTPEYNRWEMDVLSEAAKLLSIWEDAVAYGTGVQEYILVGSDSRYISKSELEGFNAEQCRLARNEIYARHGREFDDEYLQDYFNSKDWYLPMGNSDEFEESMLNSYELANRDLIVDYEKECGYR